jgi:hypothetical protein
VGLAQGVLAAAIPRTACQPQADSPVLGPGGHQKTDQDPQEQRIGQRGDRLAATQPDHMWALDFQVDGAADGGQIRFRNVVDEFSRGSTGDSGGTLADHQ